MAKIPVTIYQVVVKGVFGRNRKPKLEIFKIAQSEEPLSDDVVKARARDVLRAEKVKPGAFVRVESQPAEVDNQGGYSVVSFMLFSATLIESGWVNVDGTLGPKT